MSRKTTSQLLTLATSSQAAVLVANRSTSPRLLQNSLPMRTMTRMTSTPLPKKPPSVVPATTEWISTHKPDKFADVR